MKKILFFLAAATAMLVGCSKSELDVENTPAPVAVGKSFVGTFAMNEGTKTTVEPSQDGSKYLVKWESTDVIKVSCDESNFYNFTIESLTDGNSQAVFTCSDPDLPDDFFEKESYTATFGDLNLVSGSYTCTQAGKDDVKHLPMSATAGSQRLLNFNVSVPVMAVTIPSGVSALGLKVAIRDGSNVSTITSSTALSTYYIPVPKNSDATTKYNISAFSGASCTNEIAESMKMQAGTTMEAGKIYPFTFCPTLEITSASDDNTMKSYPATYNVRIMNAITSGTVTLAYASGASENPATVDIDAKGFAVSDLVINTPSSHVDIANGSSTKVTSKTSLATLVVKPTFKIDTTTVEEGSIRVEGKSDGSRNVEGIILKYADETAMTGTVISVAEVKAGEPVLIRNLTVSTGNQPITVVGTDNSSREKDGGYEIKNAQTQNIDTMSVAVAKIGTKLYATLEAAVAAATDGQTVTLIDNVSLNAKLDIGKSINFDLNGFTVTGCAESDKSYVFVYDGYDYFCETGSRISGKVYNGTINCNKIGVYSADHSDIVVENLTINQQRTEPAENPNFNHVAIASSFGATLTVNSGTYNGDKAASIFTSGGTIIINGGKLVGREGAYYGYVPVNSKPGYEAEGNSEFYVNAGEIVGELYSQPGTGYNDYVSKIVLSGGLYSVKPDSDYLAAGYKVSGPTAGYYLVEKAAVAKIGDKTYTSLADAVADVPTTGEQTTITMIADCNISFDTQIYVTIGSNMNVVLDLNGHKIVSGTSYDGGSHFIYNVGTLTIKDSQNGGTIEHGANPAWIYDGGGSYEGSYVSNLISNYGTLNLESGTLKNISNGSASYVADSFSSSKTNITGGQYEAKHTTFRLFYGTVQMNVSGGSFSAGGYDIAQFTGNGSSNHLTVSGGEFTTTGSFNIYSWGETAGNTSSLKISGGVFDKWVAISSLFYQEENEISGGKFYAVHNYKEENPGKFVSGGIYYGEPKAAFVKDGYAVVANTDPETAESYPYTVEKAFVKESDGKYHIYSLAGLEMFRDAVNGGNTYVGETILLETSIDLTSIDNWDPIGLTGTPFNGTFDGNYKTISNLKIDRNNHAGLFGYCINHGHINNLTVENATITTNHYAGAILAQGYADIINCHVTNSSITCSAEELSSVWDNGDKVGALAGQIQEGTYKIQNCSATNCTVKGYRDLGGLVGFKYSDGDYKSNTVTGCTVTVDNSHNYQGYTTNAQFDANEIVGECNGDLDASNTYSNVTVNRPFAE